MTFREIGRALGMSERNAKDAFHTGLRKLRRLPIEAFFPVMEAADYERAIIDRIEEWRTLGEGFEE